MRFTTLVTNVTVLSVASLAPAVAQTGDQADSPPTSSSYYLTLMNGDGEFGKMDWADLDLDGQEDVVVQTGDRLDVLFAPGIHEALVPDIANPSYEGFRVGDFAVLRRGGDTPGTRDELTVVDDEGLVILSMGQPGAPLQVTRTVLGGFNDVAILDSWTAGDGTHFVAGVTGDGSMLHTADNRSGAWSLRHTIPIAAPGGVQQLQLFDEEGTALPKLAVLARLGLAIFDPWGGDSMSYSQQHGVTYTDMVRLQRGAKSDPDELALLGEWLGLPFLIVVSKAGTSSFQMLPAADQFYVLSSGRYDTDDLDDLLVTGRGSERIYVMTDNASSAQFAPDFSFDPLFFSTYTNEPGDAAHQRVRPVFADINHSGVADIVCAMEDNRTMWIGRNPLVNQDMKRVRFENNGMADNPNVFNCGALVRSAPEDRDGDGVDESVGSFVDVRVTFPDEIDGPYLDVITWRDLPGQYGIDPNPIDVQRILTAGLEGQSLLITLSLDEASEAFVAGEWAYQVYTVFQFVEAPDLESPQTYCYPARGVVMAANDESYAPPYPIPFYLSFWVNHQTGSQSDDGSSEFPAGIPPDSGGGTDCVPSNIPPKRR